MSKSFRNTWRDACLKALDMGCTERETAVRTADYIRQAYPEIPSDRHLDYARGFIQECRWILALPPIVRKNHYRLSREVIRALREARERDIRQGLPETMSGRFWRVWDSLPKQVTT